MSGRSKTGFAIDGFGSVNTLYPNYPLPFGTNRGGRLAERAFGGNPSAMIRFDIPKTAYIQLLISFKII
jgi:hypothetical protein